MFVWSKMSPVSKQSILEDQFLGLAQTNAVITELSGKKGSVSKFIAMIKMMLKKF